MNGYANGWRAPASCREASFAFAPQAGVRWSYLISGVVCLLLVIFLVLGRLPRPRAPPELSPGRCSPSPRRAGCRCPARWPSRS